MVVTFKKSFVFMYVVLLTLVNAPVLGGGVEQINENFYTGKIPGKQLRLVMERVDRCNVALWQHYIDVQRNPRAVDAAGLMVGQGGKSLQKGYLTDGSYHFSRVLGEVSRTNNEIWVAYITKDMTPQKIPESIRSYGAGDLDDYFRMGGLDSFKRSFPQNIEMFMTVTSSPSALITSHMGIASSIEGVGRRTKGTSVNLHSFAAKVMLMRNPQRKYMVNAPVFAMEKIIADALPGFVFVGTREMKHIMEERQQISFDEFHAQNLVQIREQVAQKADKECTEANQGLENELESLGRCPRPGKTAEEVRQERTGYLSENTLLEMGQMGKFVVSEEKKELRTQKVVQTQFSVFKNPYVFPPVPDRSKRSAAFLEFMEKHPPILSVDKEKTIKQSFTLFNPDEPTEAWLTVDAANREYEWMFQGPFKPAGLTHYMVVDLVALANSRPLEGEEITPDSLRRAAFKILANKCTHQQRAHAVTVLEEKKMFAGFTLDLLRGDPSLLLRQMMMKGEL